MASKCNIIGQKAREELFGFTESMAIRKRGNAVRLIPQDVCTQTHCGIISDPWICVSFLMAAIMRKHATL